MWVASGTKRDGLTLSPLIGKAIANMVLSNKNDLIPKEFYPERKSIKTMSTNQGMKNLLSTCYKPHTNTN